MLFFVAALALSASPTPAERIARGEALLGELEYESAAYELQLAALDATATDAEKLRANLLAGIANRITGRDVEARANFRYVLIRAPSWRLDETTSPKVLLFFESIRQELAADREALAPTPQTSLSANRVDDVPSTTPNAATISGSVVAATGGLVLVGGSVGIAYAETSLADPTRDAASRSDLKSIGQWSTGGVVLGLALAATGASIVLLGLE